MGDDGDVAIRLADSSDAPAVLELFREGMVEAGEAADSGQDLITLDETFLDPDEAGLWVACTVDDGRIVGMVGIRPAGDHIAELCRLRVLSDFRGRGIGSRLIHHALAHCRERSILKVVLDSFVERRAAIALFEKLGFRGSDDEATGERRRFHFYMDLYQEPGM